MSGGEWWNEGGADSAAGDYDPSQTAATQGQLDPNTTYAPPGTSAPIDQYNFVPDPGSPGGYATYGPGQVAPVDMAAFSNQSGQYPDANSMSNAMANGLDLYPTVSMVRSDCGTTLRQPAGGGLLASTAMTRPRGASLVVWKYSSSPLEPAN